MTKEKIKSLKSDLRWARVSLKDNEKALRFFTKPFQEDIEFYKKQIVKIEKKLKEIK